MSVARKAATSAIWMFADGWFSSAVSIVSLFILARILGPEVYGTFGITVTILGVGGIFIGSTLTDSLLQRDTIEPGHYDSIFWINFVLFGLYALGMALLAPVFADLFNLPALKLVLPVMALGAFLEVQRSIPASILERDLDFKKMIIFEASLDIPMLALTIFLALQGFGVWALVLPALLDSLISIFVFARLAKWRPGFAGSRRHAGELWRFTRDTIGANCLAYVDGALPKLALGLFFGERVVGLFGIAMHMSSSLTSLLMAPFGSIAMTVTARLQKDVSKVRALMDDVFEVTTFAVYPATIGAIVLMPIIAPLLLGDRWDGIVLPLQVALLLGLRHPTGSFNMSILRGLGHTKAPLIILAAGIAILICLLPVALPYGAAGMITLVTARIFLTWPLSAALVERATSYPAHRQFTLGWRSLIAALIMGAAIALLAPQLAETLPPIISLALLVGLGIFVYGLIFAIVWPARIRAGLAKLVSLLRDDGTKTLPPELHGAAP